LQRLRSELAQLTWMKPEINGVLRWMLRHPTRVDAHGRL